MGIMRWLGRCVLKSAAWALLAPLSAITIVLVIMLAPVVHVGGALVHYVKPEKDDGRDAGASS